MSRSLDAYYWTGNHDDGVALKLNRDNSFNYDRWSDCGLDKAGNGMYTVKGNTLELNFEYDSVHITIENEYLDELPH